MVFRADEAASSGFERVKNYLIRRDFTVSEREESEVALQGIVDEYGPVVDGYPTWHPLVSGHRGGFPHTHPSESVGYHSLDHTRYFANAFITCPYGHAQEVIDSIENRPQHPCFTLSAEPLGQKFYSTTATPVLVRCQWTVSLDEGKMIPKSVAVPLMLEEELPCWRWAERAENWETMRPYFLGAPHGSRSSLFVSQDTALAMKKVYLAMVDAGMFGVLGHGYARVRHGSIRQSVSVSDAI